MMASLFGLSCHANTVSYETFSELSPDLAVTGVGEMSLVAGRLPDTSALLLREQGPVWPVQPSAEWSVELWVKPVDWTGIEGGDIKLAELSVGDTVIRLIRKAGSSMLSLLHDHTKLADFPIYDWHPQAWADSDESIGWHHLLVTSANGKVRFYVDGFPAQTHPGLHDDLGMLKEVRIHGGPGTLFDSVLIDQRAIWADAVRPRYLHQYRGTPELRRQLITVPWLENPPDDISGSDYPSMAAFGPFNLSNRGEVGPMDTSGTRAYIGFDGTKLYLRVNTPYEGTLKTRAWGVRNRPLWGEESYEIYLQDSEAGAHDYVLLVGNPHGDITDMRQRNATWNGEWSWDAAILDSQWLAQANIPFAGIGFNAPTVDNPWHFNLFNGEAGLAWSPARVFNDIESFGLLRFDRSAPVLRPGPIQMRDDALVVEFDITGRSHDRTLSIGAEVYAYGALQPSVRTAKQLALTDNEKVSTTLTLPLQGLTEGLLSVFVYDGDTPLFANSVLFPGEKPAVREGAQPDEPVVQAEIEKDRWTAEELGETVKLLTASVEAAAGVSDSVMAPWLPVELHGQSVQLWGREYRYDDSLFPVSIISQGDELLAAPIHLLLQAGGQKYILSDAEVEVTSVNESLATVNTLSTGQPFRVSVAADYTFDGMAKMTLTFEADSNAPPIEALSLVIPLREDIGRLFHYTSAARGLPPATDSGRVPEAGFSLDDFRELIWLGDNERGLGWFAESMRNWQLAHEQGIQRVSRNADESVDISITLINRPGRFDPDKTIVFAIQATPMKPRPVDFRSRSDRSTINWRWRYWGDGDFYPFHRNPVPAQRQIETSKARGADVMPTSSLSSYGRYRFYQNQFGKLDDPGLMHPEIALWEPQWRQSNLPPEHPIIPPEVHAAEGDWVGKNNQPRGFSSLCPNSPFQDIYLWRLKQTVNQTGLGAINLLQSNFQCANPLHGCGYINHDGEWTPTMPLFAMRDMIMRMRRIFYDAHGDSRIRWHAGNRIPIPIIAFVDTYMDGENYTQGELKVYEFYSDILDVHRMQSQHTGIQFGFAPDFLPKFEQRYAPTPASIADLCGLLFVHDNNTFSASTAHNAYSRYLQNLRLGFNPDSMDVAYYWQEDGPVSAHPEEVRHILHYDDEQMLLIIHNPAYEAVEARFGFQNISTLDPSPLTSWIDAVNGEVLAGANGQLNVPLKPKGIRILTIAKQSQ